MSLVKCMRKMVAGLVSAAVLLTPLAGSLVLADEHEYSVSVTPDTVVAGEETEFTATFYMDGEEFDPADEGLKISWWSESLSTGGSTSTSLTNTFTYDTVGVYENDLKVELWNPNDWSKVAGANPTITVVEASNDPVIDVPTEPGYIATLTTSPSTIEVGDEVTFTATVSYFDGENTTEITSLSDANMTLWFWNNTSDSGLDDSSGTTLVNTFTFTEEGEYEVQIRLQNSDWVDVIDAVKTTVVVNPASNVPDPVAGRVNFQGVPTLPDDFYMGVDVSSVVSELNAGVVYHDYAGNDITTVNGFIAFLASQGVNCVRVRVWNNPYDGNSNGFGGGNNDVQTARIIADACEAAGITMMVDFHLSDFWCDPAKQKEPVAWSGMSVDEKAAAISSFITEALSTIDSNRNTVVMVQVGNETNSSVCGVSGNTDMCMLFDAGCDAVHNWNSNTRAVLHFTNPERGTISSWAATLSEAGVSADVLATSYYPYWHGSLSNLTSQLSAARSYGFDVMVAETSYAYTLNDSDGHSNTVSSGGNNTGDDLLQPFSVQGQARAVRDVVNAVNNAGGIGMFYWEPAWITVGDITGLSGDALTAQIAANSLKWEQYGCGWAASYAEVYDPNDAGRWYGGSAVDNEAMFYPDGMPTGAWGVYAHIRSGEYSNEVSADGVESFNMTIVEGESLTLPATAMVTYTNDVIAPADVSWDAVSVAAVDVNTRGTYQVTGVCEGLTTTLTVTVIAANLIDPDIAGFETSDYANAYTIDGAGFSAHSTQDVHSGTFGLHWWSNEGEQGSVTLNDAIALNTAGTYLLTAYFQGDDTVVTLIVRDASTGAVIASSVPASTQGYNAWVQPEVSFTIDSATSVIIEVAIDYGPGGWGTVDDLSLSLESAAEGTTPAVVPDVIPVQPVEPVQNETTTETAAPVSDNTDTTPSAPVSTGSVIAPATPDRHDLTSFIMELYRVLLSRKADDEGLAKWRTQLENGDITLRTLVLGILMSSEYLGKNKTDEEFVIDLYHVFLGREPDAQGQADWLRRLSSGWERIDVIDGFLYSEEFRAIAEGYGLKVE